MTNAMPCSATVLERLTDAGTVPYPAVKSFDEQLEDDYRDEQQRLADEAAELRFLASKDGAAAKALFREFMDAFINADELDAILRAGLTGDRETLVADMEKLVDRIALAIAED